MKFVANGTYTIVVSEVVAPGEEPRTTTVKALVRDGGNKLSLGCETFHWSPEDNLYVGDHVPATFDARPNGTIEGRTGATPPIHAYTGSWTPG